MGLREKWTKISSRWPTSSNSCKAFLPQEYLVSIDDDGNERVSCEEEYIEIKWLH